LFVALADDRQVRVTALEMISAFPASCGTCRHSGGGAKSAVRRANNSRAASARWLSSALERSIALIRPAPTAQDSAGVYARIARVT